MPGDYRQVEDFVWALLFAKALPAALHTYDVEAQRRAISGAWDSADRTVELTRDEAQLRAAPRDPRTILEDSGFLPRRNGGDCG